MGKDDGAKLGTFVCKMIFQKYTPLWIDPSDILVFTAYLGMTEILTDFPTGSKQKMAKVAYYLFTSCWEICEYLSHP